MKTSTPYSIFTVKVIMPTLLLLLSTLLACEKEDPKVSEKMDEINSLLISKTWTVTSYSFETDAYKEEDLIGAPELVKECEKSTVDPSDPTGGSCEHCVISTLKDLQISFHQNNTVSKHTYKRKETYDGSKCTQTGTFEMADTTITYDKIYALNEETKVLKTNFGNPFYGDASEDEYFNISYNIVSHNAEKLILEGTATTVDGSITIKITLE